MKKTLLAGFISLCAVSAFADSPQLTSTLDKLSYSIGVDLGKNFKVQGININPQAMNQGMTDAMAGKQLMLSDADMKKSMTDFQKEMMAKRNADFAKKADDNKAKGAAFLLENKAKPGVVTLPSGLQYKIITKGEGVKPTRDDTVVVDYTGTLIDGQVFDSSKKTGQPATFKVSQVIPGWTEALQLMPAGSTWELYIPSDLAYGSRSLGGPIGPNETLIFNVHLLEVKKDNS